MIGRHIGAYVLEQVLGRGGMGEVYRAHDQRLGRDVAIKRVLDPDSHDNRERLRREARSLARLSHPAIVPIFDILEQDDGDWLVMELVDGVRLDHMLLDGPIAPGSAVDYGWQIARGLAESHDKGILHRDLKTENVMVTATDQVRILDFGLAKPIVSHTDDGHADDLAISKSGQILGTVRAMSPEQARGVPVDERSDLFSLGVLLYESVVGESPFADATTTATMVRVCTHRQESAHGLDPDIPRSLSDLIDELLAKAPEMRPQSATEVATRLTGIRAEMEKVINGDSEPETAAPASDTAPAHDSPWHLAARRASAGRSHRHVLLILGVAVLLVLIIAGYLSTTDYHTAQQVGAPTARPSSPSELAPEAPSSMGSRPVSRSYELLQTGRARLARYDRKGAIDEAIAAFKELSKRDPGSAVAYAGLAHAYWREYNESRRDDHWLNLARAAARRALALDEHIAWTHLAQARISRTEGQTDAARRSLARVLELDPGNAHAFLERGHLLQAAGDLDDAEAAFRQALERAPEDREILDYLGGLLYGSGRLDEATSIFRKSIEVAPDSTYGYRNLSVVLQAQNRFVEAASLLQEALEIRPQTSLYGNLGTLYYLQGFYSEAATAFEKALEYSGAARVHFRWADLGDAYRQIPGRAEDAREAYAIAIRLVRDKLTEQAGNIGWRSRLALYLARSGNHRESMSTLERLAESEDSLDSRAHYRMAIAYELCGERASALDYLHRAVKSGYAIVEIEREPDLMDLRAAPDYQRLLERNRNALEAQHKQ